MRFLDEFRQKPQTLADHLPWAALVAPGILLNKDGSFSACVAFRGPDLASSSPHELMAVRARLNVMLKRLGTGWCLHMEARRRQAHPYPEDNFANPVAWLIDAERRALFDQNGSSFETDHVATFTFLPPADETRAAASMLFEGTRATKRHAGHTHDTGTSGHSSPNTDAPIGDAGQVLTLFQRELGVLIDLMADALPEARLLDDGALLTFLHATISTKDHKVGVPETPIFLDALLADTPLTGGIAPKLGDQHLRVIGVRSFPARTMPGLLDGLGQLPFPYRWCARWIGLDKAGAEVELTRLRKRWFAKRKGMGALLREALTKEEAPLIDTDAMAKTSECDGALETLGADAASFGWLTLTVTVMDQSEARVIEKARALEASLNAQGFVARVEDLNAVEAWLGSLPCEPYADVRRPFVSSLSLCDLLPISAVWSGPRVDPHLGGAPLLLAHTDGATPFRLSLHVGDVGHTMIVGPTGAGKSAFLSFMAAQWLRYSGARVVFFDKGRSARAMTHALGGHWHALGSGSDYALQPLASIDEPTEAAWAADWIGACVEGAGLGLTPSHREEIWAALSSLAKAPRSQRTLSLFCALCQARDVSEALQPLTLNGPHGCLLDADQTTSTSAPIETFETETLMGTPSAVTPVLTALFHRLEAGFDGRPTLLVLDEAWLFLGETGFGARIRAWLKTLRKKNVAVVFATQSLDDVIASPIATTLIESCPTQIFLPNPRALEPSSAALYGMFGLNRTQLELIAYAAPKRSYYVRQPRGRRLIDLKLSGAALALCGASSPDDQALIEAIVARLGSDMSGPHFAHAFLEAKGIAGTKALFGAFDDDARASGDPDATEHPSGQTPDTSQTEALAPFIRSQNGGFCYAAE